VVGPDQSEILFVQEIGCQYPAFLAGGRTKPPLEQLMGIGVDLASPGPVNAAVARFAGTTDALEEALGQKG